MPQLADKYKDKAEYDMNKSMMENRLPHALMSVD
jgi:hypothetical protein